MRDNKSSHSESFCLANLDFKIGVLAYEFPSLC